MPEEITREELIGYIQSALPFLEEAWEACFRGQKERLLSAEERGMGTLLAQFREIAKGERVIPPGLVPTSEISKAREAAAGWAHRNRLRRARRGGRPGAALLPAGVSPRSVGGEHVDVLGSSEWGLKAQRQVQSQGRARAGNRRLLGIHRALAVLKRTGRAHGDRSQPARASVVPQKQALPVSLVVDIAGARLVDHIVDQDIGPPYLLVTVGVGELELKGLRGPAAARDRSLSARQGRRWPGHRPRHPPVARS